MKRFLSAALAILMTFAAFAQGTSARNNVPFPEFGGQDALYNFDVPALTGAPKGYKPYLIEHYGRHGSRYAYGTYFYQELMDALELGAKKGLLTQRGQRLYKEYGEHFDMYLLRMGDLSQEGWRQQQQIARVMVQSFPEVFARKGASAYASASSSTRSIMSMSGFCVGLQGAAPELDVLAEQGVTTLNATHPRDKKNPFYTQRAEIQWPFDEDPESFTARKVDSRAILGRLFTDVDAVIQGMAITRFMRHFYVTAVGMNSLCEEERTDLSGIFTRADLEALNEAQNYNAGYEWWLYIPRCAGVTEDIIADADKRLAEGRPGLTARFGHDHVALPMLRMMGVRGYDGEPTVPDRFMEIFNVKDAPMGCNVQLVFYTAEGKDVLVKVLLNGVETGFDSLGEGPYYRWEDVRAHFEARLARYPKTVH